MDQLKSKQDKLCMLLSSDPEYILKQCGDILSLNEFLEIQKQSSATDKMKVLLKIILQKDADTCQTFYDILKQHQTHYQQMQQFLTPIVEASPKPTGYADSGSVVSSKTLKNVKADSVCMKIEIERDPGRNQTGNVAGQLPQTDNTAVDGSVICADTISDSNFGNMDLSVSVKSSKVRTGSVDETRPSSQSPAVKRINDHKVELIDCLRADHPFILQHVHTKHIVTDRQYQKLKHISQPEETVTNLIDQVLGKGQESCSLFLDVLKEPDVLRTYPQLKKITAKWG